MKRIIITSDDVGLDRSATEVVRKAFEMGNITSASVVVNVNDNELVEIRNRLGEFSLGLHLNVFEGDYGKNDLGLFGGDGLFMKVLNEQEEEKTLRECLTLDGEMALQNEFVAQVEKFRRIFGRLPSHLSYHYGIHFVDEFYKTYWHIAELYQLPFRWAGQYSKVVPGYANHPDYFLDGLNNRLINETDIYKQLEKIGDGEVGELAIHLSTAESYKLRQTEIFCGNDIGERLEKLGYELVGWGSW